MRKLLLILIAVIFAHGYICADVISKEAAKLKKQGWRTFSEDPSLNEQLRRAYYYQLQSDEGWPSYFNSVCLSEVSETLMDADRQADERAKLMMYELYSDYIAATLPLSVEGDVDRICEHIIGRSSTNLTDEMTLAIRRTCKGETIREALVEVVTVQDSYSNTDTTIYTIEELINWDQVRRSCFQEPIVKDAKRIFRIYRKVSGGYEVVIRYAAARKKYED